MMYKFRLLGQTTEFIAMRLFTVAGIASVYGVTADGKRQTTARVVDVVWANSIAPKVL